MRIPHYPATETFTTSEARQLLKRLQEMEILVQEEQWFRVEIVEDHRELKEKMAAELAKLEGKMDVNQPVIDDTLREHILGLAKAIGILNTQYESKRIEL